MNAKNFLHVASTVLSFISSVKVGNMDASGIFTTVYMNDRKMYVTYAYTSFPSGEMSGTLNASNAATANGTAPKRNHGLLFPQRVLVLSIANPTSTSVTASIILQTINITAIDAALSFIMSV